MTSVRGFAGSSTIRPRPWALIGVVAAVAAFVLVSAVGGAHARLAVLLMVAPMAEEALFRVGLHEALLRRSTRPWLANAVTALAFALAHVLVRGDPAAFAVAAPALLIGAAYGRWRLLWPCVLLHAAMNAVWLAA